jgi:hypothetical protein
MRHPRWQTQFLHHHSSIDYVDQQPKDLPETNSMQPVVLQELFVSIWITNKQEYRQAWRLSALEYQYSHRQLAGRLLEIGSNELGEGNVDRPRNYLYALQNCT